MNISLLGWKFVTVQESQVSQPRKKYVRIDKTNKIHSAALKEQLR